MYVSVFKIIETGTQDVGQLLDNLVVKLIVRAVKLAV